jgi:transcription elongation factor GreB
VGFGLWVTVVDGGGMRRTWRIVGPDEADPRRGLLSVHSPVGAALLGKEVGEVAEVERPDGAAEYRVEAIRREPEPPGGA